MCCEAWKADMYPAFHVDVAMNFWRFRLPGCGSAPPECDNAGCGSACVKAGGIVCVV